MAVNPQMLPSREPLTDQAGTVTRSWWRFLNDLATGHKQNAAATTAVTQQVSAIAASLPSTFVSEVDTGSGLTGGPITGKGTVSLAPIAGWSVLANATYGAGTPKETPVGAGLYFDSGALLALWQAETVTAVGPGLTVNLGTIQSTESINAQTGTVYTIAVTDETKLITASNTASVAISLPQAGTAFPAGWFADLENINTGAVTITPAISTLDGATSLVVGHNQGLRIVSDGTNYNTQRGMGGAGGISTIVAGAGLTGGTITSTGTISLGTIAASELMGNAGTVGAVPSGIVVGSGLSLSTAGTLSANNWTAANVASLGAGLVNSSGVLSVTGFAPADRFYAAFADGAAGISSTANATRGNAFSIVNNVTISSFIQSFASITSGATLIGNVSSISSVGSIISVLGTSAAYVPGVTTSFNGSFAFSPAITLTAGTYCVSSSCSNEGTAYVLPSIFTGAKVGVLAQNFAPLTLGEFVFPTMAITAGESAGLSTNTLAMIVNYST